MMNSTLNHEDITPSIDTVSLDGNISTNTLIGSSNVNTLVGVQNANTLIGSIGSGVIGSGIKSIYLNDIQQTVVDDVAYISLTYDMIYDLPTIPTKVSELENDEGYINSGYATEDDFTALSNQVGIIQNTVDDVVDDIESVEGDIDTINATLINKVDSSDFNTLSNQVTANTNNISTNTNNISTNTNNITSLTNITDAQSATITSMTSLIEDNSDAIGTLSNLTTTDKTNLVSAINEVKGDIPTTTSQLTNDSNYVTTTSYANSATGGVIKTSTTYNYFASSGILNASINTYATYMSKSNNAFISKGTLENVITGKGLVNSTQLATKQDTLVSGTNIKTINSQSLLGSGDITISGGQATDVQINGTSITSANVADIQTNGTYNSSSNKIATMSDIPTVPTDVSQLNNDAGYITNTVNDLTNYTLTSNLATVATTGAYSDLSGTPTVPTKTSDLTNDSGYVTNTDYASASTGGVVKTGSYGFNIGGAGVPYPSTSNYTTYLTLPDYHFIGKGTLENVIAGKKLASDSTYTITKNSTYVGSTTLYAYRVGNVLFVSGAIQISASLAQHITFLTIENINSTISGNQYGGSMHQANSSSHRLRCSNDSTNIIIQGESSTMATGWYNLMFIINI